MRTVNFAELATGFSGKAQIDSHYKRLQRFFRSDELNYSELAQTGVALMDIPEPWTLSLDRTEWQFGDCVFNILMLGGVHQGVAFPLVWRLLDKRDNANRDERMMLFNQFLNASVSEKIKQAFSITLISLVLGHPYWRMAPSTRAIDDQKTWTQSQEYFSLSLGSSAKHCSQFGAENG